MQPQAFDSGFPHFMLEVLNCILLPQHSPPVQQGAGTVRTQSEMWGDGVNGWRTQDTLVRAQSLTI